MKRNLLLLITLFIIANLSLQLNANVSKEDNNSNRVLINWRHSEIKVAESENFTGDSYSYLYKEDLGNSRFIEHTITENWDTNEQEWYVSRDDKRWYTNEILDSIINLTFNASNKLSPSFGLKYIYPNNPIDNADFETYYHSYNTVAGWELKQHDLYYRNEEGDDTLRITYGYANNQLISETHNISHSKREGSLTKNYNTNGDVHAGYASYTMFHENGLEDYHLYYTFNNTSKTLELRDSTKYLYKDGYVDRKGLKFSGSDIRGNYLIRHYYNASVHRPDSIVTFIVSQYLDDNNELIIDQASKRQEFEYDEYGNILESRTYEPRLPYETELILKNQELRTFQYVLNQFRVKTFKQYLFKLGDTIDDDYMYLSTDQENLYNENGKILESRVVGRNQADEITQDSGSNYVYTYASNSTEITQQKLYSFGNLNRETVTLIIKRELENDDFISQNTLINLLDGQTSRTGQTNGSAPIIFDDGPIKHNIGDTISLYISAKNPDKTAPDIELSNIPATASFNPATSHFFWIVDTVNPAPMQYKAINNDGTTVVFTGPERAASNDVNSRTISVIFENILQDSPSNVESVHEISGFELSQNYPNPFNISTNISFNLSDRAHVSLSVYDMQGRKLTSLVDGVMDAGLHTVQFDGDNLDSGMYIYQLRSGNSLQAKKMMLVK